MKTLEEKLQNDNTRLRNYVALGNAYINRGDYQKAAPLLRKAELAFPLKPEEGLELKWLQAKSLLPKAIMPLRLNWEELPWMDIYTRALMAPELWELSSMPS